MVPAARARSGKMQRAPRETALQNLMPIVDTISNRLNERADLPPLFPTKAFDPQLSRLILDSDFVVAGHDAEYEKAMHCGLLLLNDDLEAAHPIAQELKNATGSFWHAIIHRREGDFANSNYWWRMTGNHPAFPAIHQAALEVLQGQTEPEARKFAALLQQEKSWQPEAFVACCREAKGTSTDDAWLRQVQLCELQTFLDWCHNSAA